MPAAQSLNRLFAAAISSAGVMTLNRQGPSHTSVWTMFVITGFTLIRVWRTRF
jgi:hypothetical protein